MAFRLYKALFHNLILAPLVPLSLILHLSFFKINFLPQGIIQKKYRRIVFFENKKQKFRRHAILNYGSDETTFFG